MSEARTIAQALKGRPYADGYLCCCPLPTHGKGRGDRSPSLLVKDGDRATLFKCFGGCDARDILAELRARGLSVKLTETRPAISVQSAPKSDHIPDAEAVALWTTAGPIAGTKAAAYLRARGITLDPPASLRAARVMHLDSYPFPALIAAVQAPERHIIAVQKTLIDPRGDRKAQVRIPRQTMGALGWGAVRLGAATHTLGIAEGIEKALAAMQLFHVPCWASLGAARMHRVWIPDTVSTLHIFADNDDAGRAAAERTAHAHRHRKVLLRFPPEQLKDWDDILLARTAAPAAVDERGAA
jgi:putative DNA primase/helicase